MTTFLNLTNDILLEVDYSYYPAEKGIKDYLGFQEEPDVDEIYTIENIKIVQGTLMQLFDWLNNKQELSSNKCNLYELLEQQLKESQLL